jgi:hypothetical protein
MYKNVSPDGKSWDASAILFDGLVMLGDSFQPFARAKMLQFSEKEYTLSRAV